VRRSGSRLVSDAFFDKCDVVKVNDNAEECALRDSEVMIAKMENGSCKRNSRPRF